MSGGVKVRAPGKKVVWMQQIPLLAISEERFQALAPDKFVNYPGRNLLPRDPDRACGNHESHYPALDGMFRRMGRQTSGKRRMLIRRPGPGSLKTLSSHRGLSPTS